MASKSVLTNAGTETFESDYNGTVYRIEPGESITVNRRTAVGLRGTYTGRKKTVKLILEHLPSERNKMYTCHFCGVDFADQKTLDAHLKTHKTAQTEEVAAEKVYVSDDGREFKSKQALLSYLRALKRKEQSNNDSSTGSSDNS